MLYAGLPKSRKENAMSVKVIFTIVGTLLLLILILGACALFSVSDVPEITNPSVKQHGILAAIKTPEFWTWFKIFGAIALIIGGVTSLIAILGTRPQSPRPGE
jgi:hypothetical protein